MREQIDIECASIRGRVIESVARGYDNQTLFITFKGNTFTCLKAFNGDNKGDSPYIENMPFDIYETDTEAAVSIGILTKEEVAEMRAERDKRHREMFESQERQQYLRLKAKFEKEDAS